MKLEVALQKLGAEVVRSSAEERSTTVLLRVKQAVLANWSESVKEVLLQQEGQTDRTWNIDISRVYFAAGGSVRFLWRLVFTGDAQEASSMFGMAIIRVLSRGVEVTSQPLVGRVTPQPGSWKGGHALGAQAGALSEFQTKG